MESNKLTTKSQEAISAAVRLAADRGHPAVEAAHLLQALLAQTDGTATPLLRAVGADVADVQAENDAVLTRLPSASGATVSAPQLGRDMLRVLSAAQRQAEQLTDEYLSTQHLLVGLAAEGGPVAGILKRHGASPDALLAAFTKVRGGSRVTSQDPESTYQALEKYGVDLTALARGELRMVGATTLDEYRQHIEKDPALERRFQPVLVGEPSAEDTIGILRGLKGRYEAHHQVQIADSALVAAATLSDRYVTGRFLPDKAIDLVD